MAGAIFVTDELIWSASTSGFHWVGEFFFDHIDNPQAKEYVREVLDHNIGSIALDELPPDSRRQALHLLRNELISDAQRRLPSDPVLRQDYLGVLRELEEMAKKASP